MSFEAETRYVAYCSGPSDLGPGCPRGDEPFEDLWGDTAFEDDMDLVRALQAAGWYVELMPSGYAKRNAEVMCIQCREAAGE